MDENYFAILTNLGQAMVAASIVDDTRIKLTELAVGDANYTPTEGQTSLMNERARFPINEIWIDEENPAWLRITAIIPPDAGGWRIHEIGIFDESGNMFAVGKLDGAYKPLYSSGMVKEVAIDLILEVSSDANIELAVDPHVIIATRKWVIEHFGGQLAGLEKLMTDHIKRKDNPHETKAAQVGAYTTAETDAKVKAVNDALISHRDNKQNPHETSAGQVGAYTRGETDAKIKAVDEALDGHKNNKSNPHNVTAAQAGASPVGHKHKSGDISDLQNQYTQSFKSNGWCKLPNGLILQWMLASIPKAETSATIAFPIPFPNACLNAIVTTRYSSWHAFDDSLMLIVGTPGKASVVVGQSKVGGPESVFTDSAYIMAIGH